MAVVLGLAVAVAYGAADFFGGVSAKRSPVAGVVVLSQVLGLPVLAVLVPIAGGDPTTRALVLGGIAGAAGGIGLVCLYAGLARGRMSVVAPITAVGAAIVPVLWGLSTGERPSAVALAGVAVALVAVVLVSASGGSGRDELEMPSSSRPKPVDRTLALAIVAGLGFGGVFVALGETGDDVGMWPLVATRFVSVTMLASGALLTRRPLRSSSTVAAAIRTIVAAGVLDMTANVLYLLATREGLLSLVAVLSSLYPAATVLLARAVLGERIGRVQLGGLALASAGVVLIAAG